MLPHKTEGVILQTLKFQDYDQIATLFTQDEGLIKVLIKYAYSKKYQQGAITTPLSRVEVVFTRKNELCFCKEMRQLHAHQALRQTMERLEAATRILQIILKTQLPQKPAPELYALLILFLEKMEQLSDPALASLCFGLKVLRHEGHWHLTEQCSSCSEQLSLRYIASGESYCRRHAPAWSVELSSTEADYLNQLAFMPSLSELKKLSVPEGIQHKVSQLLQDIGQSC